MKYDLLIRNGTVVRDNRVERADIAVDGERIVEIARALGVDAREMIDATGLHVFPGVIDPHVHFNEPGRTEWEGFATGSAALAAGGGTLFFDMPLNSSPPVLDGVSFDLKLEAAKRSSLTDFALWGGLTPKNLDRMEELAERGVVGFKAFMCDSGIDEYPRADDHTLWEGMKRAAQLRLPVAVHAENHEIVAGLASQRLAAGRTSSRDYLDSRPAIAETEAVRRAIALADDALCSLHIVHVSTPAVFYATADLNVDVDLSFETCPHYLLLDETELVRLGAVAKCAPPLRSSDERREMNDLVRDSRRIAMIGSDHSPAPESMKQGSNFFSVWGGVAGVQSTLSALLTVEPALRPERVAALTATNAAKRFGIRTKGSIDIGYEADFALVSVNRTFELRREDLLDRHKLSPYVGRTFRGVIRRTILRGRTIFMDGTTVGPPSGKFVRPAR